VSATIKLDCDGSAEVFANDSSPVEAFCVCRRNAARPTNASGESPAGTSGSSPSADGANPTADNSVEANGVFTGWGSGVDTTTGPSSGAFVVCDVTSTTDTSLVAAGADTGSDFGRTATLVSAAGSLSLTSLADGVLMTDRFGFLGVVEAAFDESDFLSLTVDPVDFLLLSLSVGLSASAALSPASAGDPATSTPESPEGSDDPAAAAAPDDDEPSLEPDEDDDDESDDEAELVESASVGSAHATPGVLATATPTPKATAKPPTRPTYLAYPMTTPLRVRTRNMSSKSRDYIVRRPNPAGLGSRVLDFDHGMRWLRRDLSESAIHRWQCLMPSGA
jgi:hypothetical protein